jgi:hypothetical protein
MITNDLPGFDDVATMTIIEGQIAVTISNERLSESFEAVYVWCTPSGHWLRVGTSCSRPLRKRLLDYPKHFNRVLSGEDIKHTPRPYAEKWHSALVEHGTLGAKAYHPPAIATPVGLVRPTLDIERFLIKLNGRPPLNRGHH